MPNCPKTLLHLNYINLTQINVNQLQTFGILIEKYNHECLAHGFIGYPKGRNVERALGPS